MDEAAQKVAQREKAFRLIQANPDVRDILDKALNLEETGRAENQFYLGWTWEDIGVNSQKLRVLVEEGLIKVNYHSNSAKDYLIVNPELICEALKVTESSEVDDGKIPPDLFDNIIGHDEPKYWLKKSLAAPEPVHILLVGPPATAKSLFLEGLGNLSGAQYALGGSSSKAGIADFLLNFAPRYLVIDELEKMSGDDFSVLLSLMSIGVVARLKKGMRDVKHMTVTVFAGVNKIEKLPPELLSRFIRFNFNAYTLQEFVDVATTVITSMGKEPNLAQYIAERVAVRTRDVRQAIQLAKLVDSREDVDRFEGGKLL
ncbi:hypothetical protein LCGC14_0918620 [marine sediment metagenome]|uniref:ATPase AAA-type core domain-containing protein n=1 Tax=marine sediment metagenome TaxID=412755 RepID=A0A0F9NWA5_9ZZZZ